MREHQATTMALLDRVTEGPWQSVPLEWADARLQMANRSMPQVGLVVILPDSVTWITRKSLALSPRSWGPDDFGVWLPTITLAASSPSAGHLGRIDNYTEVQIHPPGGNWLRIETTMGSPLTFTHLDELAPGSVLRALDDKLSARSPQQRP